MNEINVKKLEDFILNNFGNENKSVEEKANIKEVLVPYVVGCIVIFGAFAIWKLIVTILGNSFL